MKPFVATQPQTTSPPTVSQDIEVSGDRTFAERQWREALLYYLNGVWGGNVDVTYRPKINFNGFTLKFEPTTDTYYAYGSRALGVQGSKEAHAERVSRMTLQRHDIDVMNRRTEVEIGLIRFVRDDTITGLRIIMPNAARTVMATLTISKTSRRGEYALDGGVDMGDLPSMDEARKFYGLL